MSVEIGALGAADMIVAEADTAAALGSGDVFVLGTPRLIALLEAATCAALAGELDEDNTSVGVAIDIKHRRPTLPGSRVTASASVSEVDGARITFDVSASHVTPEGESVEGIAVGTITRVIVDRELFSPR